MANFAHFDELHLGGIERGLKTKKYVEPKKLAVALRKHGSRPIPSEVLSYLYRLLEGRVPKPKGRKSLPEFDRRRQVMIIAWFYQFYLKQLTDRKQRYGFPAGWTKLDWPPAEIAARIVARQFMYGAESWRRVQNIASSQK